MTVSFFLCALTKEVKAKNKREVTLDVKTLGAIFSVKLGKGFFNGYEYDLSLLAMSVALILSGSNTFALGNLFRSWTTSSPAKKAV